MFERYTDRARRTFALAREHALANRHDQIGTEHLLLGLADDDWGIAAEILHEHGLTLDVVRNRVLERHPEGTSAPAGHIPFTQQAKRVIEMSLRESLNLALDYIGTEHVLLGLSHAGEGTGAVILNEAIGGDSPLQTLRQEVFAKAAARPRPEPAYLKQWRPVPEPNRISLGADDLFRSRTFYAALGLPIHETEDHRLIAQLPGGSELELTPSSRRRRTTGLQLRFQVDDVERAVDALTAAGHDVEVRSEGRTRTAVVEDPDQNTVILTEKLAQTS